MAHPVAQIVFAVITISLTIQAVPIRSNMTEIVLNEINKTITVINGDTREETSLTLLTPSDDVTSLGESLINLLIGKLIWKKIIAESRKGGGGGAGGQSSGQKDKKQKGMMNKILPMLIIPFIISTGIIPLMLAVLKFMLIKSALIGKIAVILLLFNMFRARASGEGGVYNHTVNKRDISALLPPKYKAYRRKRRKVL